MKSRSIATSPTLRHVWPLPALVLLAAPLVPRPSVSQAAPAASAPSVSAGGLHSCGLTAEGTAYCWGWNANGQLGNGTGARIGEWLSEACRDSVLANLPPGVQGQGVSFLVRSQCTTTHTPENSNVPVAVSGGLTFQSVSAGTFHSCGVTTAGAAYCWGRNDQRQGVVGQLGDGTNIDRDMPVPVAGGLTFHSVSAGWTHSCGVTTTGAAYCWGSNGIGQLGDGTRTTSTVPVAVAGGLTFQAVSAGSVHSCGVTMGGAAYCWGNNDWGQLGNGDRANPAGLAGPVAVAGGLTFQSVSPGKAEHYLSWMSCGVSTAGTAYCWGFFGLGEDFRPIHHDVPVAVAGGLTFQWMSAGGGMGRELSQGTRQCGVTTTGAAYCWGVRGADPVALAGGLTFQSVSTGAHSCGVTTDGTAYCWDGNRQGQLGDGTNTRSIVPVAVSGGLTFATSPVPGALPFTPGAIAMIGVAETPGPPSAAGQACFAGAWAETAADFTWTITSVGDSLRLARDDQAAAGVFGWDAGRNRWTGTLRWWNGGLYPGMTLDPATPGCEFPQLTITSPGLTAVMARAANDPS